MKLVAKSRDQGFSDDPLAGNWTWFEIAILKTKYSEEPRVKDGIQLVWVSHRNRFLSKDYGWVSTPVKRQSPEGTDLITGRRC
jgi:hypothetical protein